MPRPGPVLPDSESETDLMPPRRVSTVYTHGCRCLAEHYTRAEAATVTGIGAVTLISSSPSDRAVSR